MSFKNAPLAAEQLVLGIDHIAIAVEDLRESINWYVKALGFTLCEERTTTGAHTSMLSAVLTAGESVVVLVQGTSPESQVCQFIERFGPGVQHIALRVANLSDAIKHAEQTGAASDITPIEGDGIKQTFLRRDPGSGVRVELIERNGGTFNDASVEQLFREFERRGLY